jgi:hypothetical protein
MGIHLNGLHVGPPMYQEGNECVFYGPYTITKAMGDNSFELNIPPFLGLNPVFNVDLFCPYFPPLLDTSDVAEKLTPTDLNLNYIQKASNDQIVDT